MNAPNFSQSALQLLLKDVPNITIFVDDIIIFTKTKIQNIPTLKLILQIFAKNNIVINFEKSQMLKERIKYLGFEISQYKYRPDQKRIPDMTQWEPPTTRNKLRQILGIVNCYREFIPYLARMLAGMYKKLEGNERKVTVTRPEMATFSKIYDILRKENALYFPNLEETFHLHTDASEKGLGAIQEQKR